MAESGRAVIRVPLKFEYPYSLKNVLQAYLAVQKQRSQATRKENDKNVVFSMERALPKLISAIAKKNKVKYEETLTVESQDVFVTTSKQMIPLINCEVESKISYTGDGEQTVCFGAVKFELGKKWVRVVKKQLTDLSLKTFKQERSEEVAWLEQVV